MAIEEQTSHEIHTNMQTYMFVHVHCTYMYTEEISLRRQEHRESRELMIHNYAYPLLAASLPLECLHVVQKREMTADW